MMYSILFIVLHLHISAAIMAIFRVMVLLQEYKCENLVSCVTFTP
jgi:hypothetical protein